MFMLKIYHIYNLDLGRCTFWSTLLCLDPMPVLKEIFDTFGFMMFSTLDLCFGYHQLLLRKGDKVNTTFWGIDFNEKDCLY
jgi:hypothetical protein